MFFMGFQYTATDVISSSGDFLLFFSRARCSQLSRIRALSCGTSSFSTGKRAAGWWGVPWCCSFRLPFRLTKPRVAGEVPSTTAGEQGHQAVRKEGVTENIRMVDIIFHQREIRDSLSPEPAVTQGGISKLSRCVGAFSRRGGTAPRLPENGNRFNGAAIGKDYRISTSKVSPAFSSTG
jgi:hypothetical protein